MLLLYCLPKRSLKPRGGFFLHPGQHMQAEASSLCELETGGREGTRLPHPPTGLASPK